jgi:hypothetical protein
MIYIHVYVISSAIMELQGHHIIELFAYRIDVYLVTGVRNGCAHAAH